MAEPLISTADLLAIHDRVRSAALADRAMRYDNPDGGEPSLVRLEAIAERMPSLDPARLADWVLRAVVLLQPFPDGNHRTGVLAAEVILERAGRRLRPNPEQGAAFQKDVSGRRKVLLSGYGEAPLSVLASWEDEVMDSCEAFIRAALGERSS